MRRERDEDDDHDDQVQRKVDEKPKRRPRVKNDELVNERKENLARDLMNLAAVAQELGFVVIADDVKAAARLVKKALPSKHFSRPEDRWRWST